MTIIRSFSILLVMVPLVSCGNLGDERYRCGDQQYTVFSVLLGGGIGLGTFDYYPDNLPSWAVNVAVTADRARLAYKQSWAGLDDESNHISGTHLYIYELDRQALTLSKATRDWNSDYHEAPPWDTVQECTSMSQFAYLKLLILATLTE